jgi:hypothetical protein
MYAPHEASQLRQAFWTAFGLYMAPVPAADGEKKAWINYKTGEKHLYFKMHAGNNSAYIAIMFSHPDAGVRQLYFEQMKELKPLLQSFLPEPWNWEPSYTDEQGRSVSRVIHTLEETSVLRKTDWPRLVSFFKPRIIALDAFWAEARYYFEALR